MVRFFALCSCMAKKRTKTDAFSYVLRAVRNEKCLSQEDLAARLDLTRTYISYLESGKRYPSLEMLIALAQALDVRPGELLDRIAERLETGKASPLEKQPGGFKPQ